MFPEPSPSRRVPALPPRTALRLPWTSYVDLVRTRAESQPERLAVFGLPKLAEVGARFTWAQMDRRVRALAARLQEAGAAGEPVILLQENDPLYLMSFLACAYAGAVAVPMPPLAHARHLARLTRVLQDCGATRILTTADLRARCAADLAAAVPDVRWILADEVDDAAASAWDDHYPDAADIAFLQYTSGSTSTPKGVVVRHADLVWQGESFERVLALGPDDRALCWMPLFHDLGLILGSLQALYSGLPLAITSPAAFVKAPERWLQAISDHRITVSGGPNFAYDLCAEVVDPARLPGLDLSCWAQALNAAEPIRAGTIDRFVAKFAPYGFRPEAMQPGYGLAEATVGVAIQPRGQAHVRRAVDPEALAAGRVVTSDAPDARVLVASGRALPGLELRIVDPDTAPGTEGVPLPPDVVGEVWTSCDHFPETYWNLDSRDVFAARVAGAGAGRRFGRTGDLGFLDAAGNLTITGRRKDLLIVAGKNHYPQDIELTVEEASRAVRPNFVAAFSVEAGAGEAEVAVVVAEIRRDAEPAAIAAARAAIRHAIAERHELAVHDVHLVVQGQIPKTTSGKIQRARCRELWAGKAFVVVA